jgi:3-isopropylmalate/(R)-2-methylmalate dehydratase large subunit
VLLLFAEIHTLPPTVPLDYAFGLVLQVEMVLSTQCIMQPKPKNAYQRSWWSSVWVTPKDVAFIISKLSSGYWLFCGIRRKSFEDMTWKVVWPFVTVSKWARGGMIAPDQTTFDYLEGRLYTQKALLGIQP